MNVKRVKTLLKDFLNVELQRYDLHHTSTIDDLGTS